MVREEFVRGGLDLPLYWQGREIPVIHGKHDKNIDKVIEIFETRRKELDRKLSSSLPEKEQYDIREELRFLEKRLEGLRAVQSS